MAKMKNIIHSEDACTMVFKGDLSNPEPSLGVIKFPGGYVEVSRCSDGSYYAHISADKADTVLDSRIDYSPEYASKNGIPSIKDHNQVTHIAMKIKGQYIATFPTTVQE